MNAVDTLTGMFIEIFEAISCEGDSGDGIDMSGKESPKSKRKFCTFLGPALCWSEMRISLEHTLHFLPVLSIFI